MQDSSAFADLEGKPPRRRDSSSDVCRRIGSWQSWISQGRGPALLLHKLSEQIDSVTDDFATSGEFMCPDAMVIHVMGHAIKFPCSKESLAPLLDSGSLAGFGRKGCNHWDPQVRSTLQFAPDHVQIEPGFGKGGGKGEAATTSSGKGAAAKNPDEYVAFMSSYKDRIKERQWLKGGLKGAGDSCDLLANDMSSSDQLCSPFLETVRRCLFPFNCQIRAKLYKLLLYRPGDHFDAPHQDTALGPEHVGTLVVCLPTLLPSHGGDLHVEHGGQRVTFENMPRRTISWVAFYSSCSHRVSQVFEGNRVVLIYGIFRNDAFARTDVAVQPTPQSVVHGASQFESVAWALAKLMADSSLPQRPVALLMKHEYPWKSSTDLRGLKGADRTVYQAAELLGLRCRLQPVIVEGSRERHVRVAKPEIIVFSAGEPFPVLLKRTVTSVLQSHCALGDLARSAITNCLLAFLSRPLLPTCGLPMSVNWVVDPERALGIALMAEEGGRYTGNEFGEMVLHYYHVALLISSQSVSQRMLQSEFAQQSLPLDSKFLLSCRDGDIMQVLTSLQQGIDVEGEVCARGLSVAVSRNCVGMVETLLGKKANPCLLDATGDSAWRAALRSGRGTCAEVLASKGAHPSMCDDLLLVDRPLRDSLEIALVGGLVAAGDIEAVQDFFKSKQLALGSTLADLARERQRGASLEAEVKAKHAELRRVFGKATAQDRTLRRKTKKLRNLLAKPGRPHPIRFTGGTTRSQRTFAPTELQENERCIDEIRRSRLERAGHMVEDRWRKYRESPDNGRFWWHREYDGEWFYESQPGAWQLYTDPSSGHEYWCRDSRNWFFTINGRRHLPSATGGMPDMSGGVDANGPAGGGDGPTVEEVD